MDKRRAGIRWLIGGSLAAFPVLILQIGVVVDYLAAAYRNRDMELIGGGHLGMLGVNIGLFILMPVVMISLLLFVATRLPWTWVHWPGAVLYVFWAAISTNGAILLAAYSAPVPATLGLNAVALVLVLITAVSGPRGWRLIREAHEVALPRDTR